MQTELTCVGCAFQGQEQAGKCSVCPVTDRSAIAGPRPEPNPAGNVLAEDENPAGVEAVCESCGEPCEYDSEVCLCTECVYRSAGDIMRNDG